LYENYKVNCTKGANYTQCSIKEMAYGQWIDGCFLKNAPAAWGVATNESYTRAFPNHTTL